MNKSFGRATMNMIFFLPNVNVLNDTDGNTPF